MTSSVVMNTFVASSQRSGFRRGGMYLLTQMSERTGLVAGIQLQSELVTAYCA